MLDEIHDEENTGLEDQLLSEILGTGGGSRGERGEGGVIVNLLVQIIPLNNLSQNNYICVSGCHQGLNLP